jgi:ABC-type glutathione transport system ATPase component
MLYMTFVRQMSDKVIKMTKGDVEEIINEIDAMIEEIQSMEGMDFIEMQKAEAAV